MGAVESPEALKSRKGIYRDFENSCVVTGEIKGNTLLLKAQL